MLRHGLIIALKNHSCFPWKSSFHVFDDPSTPGNSPYLCDTMWHPHSQLECQKDGLNKLIFPLY